jgi:hypothetical protein
MASSGEVPSILDKVSHMSPAIAHGLFARLLFVLSKATLPQPLPHAEGGACSRLDASYLFHTLHARQGTLFMSQGNVEGCDDMRVQEHCTCAPRFLACTLLTLLLLIAVCPIVGSIGSARGLVVRLA